MVSIIIPIFNSENFLDDCLKSISNQTFKDIEVICINDGSTDRSSEIVKKYSVLDSRFELIEQTNGGVSSARNRALEAVKGEYICFVDSDDIISENHIATLYKLVQGYDVAVTSYTRDLNCLGSKGSEEDFLESNAYIKQIIGEQILRPQIVCMLYKTQIIKDNNLSFTLGCVRNEDAEFFIKYLANITKVHTCNYIGFYYRENEQSAVHKFNEKSLTFIEADRRISKYLQERNIYPSVNYIMSSSVQYFVYKCARQKNKDMYDLVHEKYDVRNEMKNMLRFPRKARVIIAYLYLLSGKKLFYKIMSLL